MSMSTTTTALLLVVVVVAGLSGTIADSAGCSEESPIGSWVYDDPGGTLHTTYTFDSSGSIKYITANSSDGSSITYTGSFSRIGKRIFAHYDSSTAIFKRMNYFIASGDWYQCLSYSFTESTLELGIGNVKDGMLPAWFSCGSLGTLSFTSAVAKSAYSPLAPGNEIAAAWPY